MRIGVLGGSFNPPHNGHLIVASDAFEALRLDRLIVVPAFANPLKGIDLRIPEPAHRLAMVHLAFGNDTRFEVSAMEIERGGLSYTVDTLEALSASNPGAELVLLMGMDSLRTLEQWKSPDRIRELASVAVLARQDVSIEDSLTGVTAVTARRVDLSSSEIRARIRDGKSVKGFVAESVENYIATAELYRSPAHEG